MLLLFTLFIDITNKNLQLHLKPHINKKRIELNISSKIPGLGLGVAERGPSVLW
jgi:hypothetical protein